MSMQHQFFVTKKSVLRKFGSKEDECIVSSDAELDAKLELFRSISESCVQLQKVIDLYQERLCYLAHEENFLGRYLKECGKNERNPQVAKVMNCAGKALSNLSHQRMTIRNPLVRLHHDVDTFRQQAVSDTRASIIGMEKSRTEYRASLEWIKSASQQLDPERTNLSNFRKAQNQVRLSKQHFDKWQLTCLQKVDLLAAARCNMFSYSLDQYEKSVCAFVTKANLIISTNLNKMKTIIAEQDQIVLPNEENDIKSASLLETEQKLIETSQDDKTFFNAQYSDQKKIDELFSSISITNEKSSKIPEDLKNRITSEREDSKKSLVNSKKIEEADNCENSKKTVDDLLFSDESSSYLEELMNSKTLDFGTNLETNQTEQNLLNHPSTSLKDLMPSQLLNLKTDNAKQTTNSKSSWFDLFAELDPLSNPDMINNINSAHTSA